MSYIKLANEFGGVYEVGNIFKDVRETVETVNGWKLQYFLTYERTSDRVDVDLNIEANGYTGVILNQVGNIMAIFFAHRKFFMVEYLKELSGCNDIYGYDGISR